MKITVGILRESKDKIQSYVDKGYHVEYLDNHAREIGEKLLDKKNLTEEEIIMVRERGYAINSMFWVNLAMTSAKSYDKIVIADLQEEDNKKFLSKVV